MRFNEWTIFIKESRDWCVSKWCSKDNCLIKNHDDKRDVVIIIIDILRYLSDDFVRILLIFRVLIWYHMWEMIDDCIYYVRDVFKNEVSSWFRMNLYNVWWLYWLIWVRWK